MIRPRDARPLLAVVPLVAALLACDGASDPSLDAPPSSTSGAGAVDAGGPASDAARDASPPARDASSACTSFTTSLASLTAHDTSASPTYDQAHFAANFGTTSWISVSGGTAPVDPTKMDMSMNPVTPGHVSNVDVHTLVPSRPDLRWFAHVTPWFKTGGGNHIDIGLECNSTAYVQAMVTDIKNRGFDGLIVDWYGKGSYEDQVTLLVQKYVATLPAGSFSFIVMMDKGIPGLSESVLTDQIAYVKQQYFGDPSYEREGNKPILMFFGVSDALGDATMANVKAAAGADTVWVVQGTTALAQDWVDQAFDWTHDFHDGVDPSDPYNTGSVGDFYATMAHQTKKAFGSMAAGFNGTLTKSVSWSMGKYLPRGYGACIVEWAKKIDATIPPNVTRMQWATWSDWEEGTQIESGVENGIAVTASIRGKTLAWSVAGGTGDESTIDHYEIYASKDGANAADLGRVEPGTRAFDPSACLVPGASYTLYVNAVGKPNIRDHLSAPVAYAP